MEMVFLTILGTLFLMACSIGVIAIYFSFKEWVGYTFDIDLPPRTNQSFWETDTDSVMTPVYICQRCHYSSDKKHKYCPYCGISMKNSGC